MQEPIYTCKENELSYELKNRSKILYVLKICLWVILLLIIVFSLVFRENLFKSMPWSTVALLFASLVGISIKTGEKSTISPMEIRFYEDYLIVYRNKFFYNRHTSRREFNKFYFKDIEKIEYRTTSKMVAIYGKANFKWFDYKKDGTVPDEPTYDRQVDSLCYFYKTPESNTDYVMLFEKYTPIKVEISDL